MKNTQLFQNETFFFFLFFSGEVVKDFVHNQLRLEAI